MPYQLYLQNVPCVPFCVQYLYYLNSAGGTGGSLNRVKTSGGKIKHLATVPLSDDEFAYAVLEAVKEIPAGKVASYGMIADLTGYPENSRLSSCSRLGSEELRRRFVRFNRPYNRAGRWSGDS